MTTFPLRAVECPEDPHNSFLDAFTTGGWLVVVVRDFRAIFSRSPWQATYIAAYTVFVGEVSAAYIIDVQHWRHYGVGADAGGAGEVAFQTVLKHRVY